MKLAYVPIALAVLSALALVASGFGARYGIWDFRFGFQLLRWSFYAGLATAVLALVRADRPPVRAGHAVELVAALLIGMCASRIFHGIGCRRPRALPSDQRHHDRHDESTGIVAIVPLRASSAVPTTYPGRRNSRQAARRYPDIKDARARHASGCGLCASAGYGDQLRLGNSLRGDPDQPDRIEATATTPWFGFRDDIVIRVQPAPGGSRVDVRSLSRVGKGDLGANAKRIRAYLAKLSG
jgi:hypothetical protein